LTNLTAQQGKESAITRFRNSRIITIVFLASMGIAAGLISMMLGSSYYGMPMFYAYFSSPVIVLLNLLPPVLLLLFFYFATGRAWISVLTASFIVLSLSVIDFFKIQVRSDPLVPSDFKLADEAGNVLDGYALIVNWKVYLSAAFLIGAVLFAVFFMRARMRAKVRVIGTSALLVLSAALYVTIYTSPKIYEAAQCGYEINKWSSAQNSIARGFLYPFLYSFQFSGPPDGYNREEAEAALNAYGYDYIAEEQKVNIVSVMLESYADLSLFEQLDFNVDVYKGLHDLEAEAYAGVLVDNVFAGGTTDTERSFLTGLTELDDFQKPSNSYLYYLKEQGYHTEGLHAGEGWFYGRDTVHANLGFDNYYFLEDYQNGNRWDGFFFPEVINLYEKRDVSVPYFSYSLSYQNHGPYDTQTTVETAYIKQGNLSDASYHILNNYLNGIYDTTLRITDFVNYFRTKDEPVVLVLFGDHKPWLGNDYSVYDELGVNIDLSTPEGVINFYSTPYLIWANDAAKTILGNDFQGFGGFTSPCFLMNELFDLCAWDGDEYMKAADDLRRFTTVVNTGTGYFTEDGVLTHELSDEALDVYNSFKKLEYYRRQHFYY
jgi:phosphoglycerol transferase MdoB-like AlkP superfamily enzyme